MELKVRRLAAGNQLFGRWVPAAKHDSHGLLAGPVLGGAPDLGPNLVTWYRGSADGSPLRNRTVRWRSGGPRSRACECANSSRRRARRKMPMGQLFDTIRQLVADEKYVVGQHATERLEERGIMEWQVVTGSRGRRIDRRTARRDAKSGRRGTSVLARRHRASSCLVSPASERRREARNCPLFSIEVRAMHSRRANQTDTANTDREVCGCGRSRDGRTGR